jgi:CBS domain-containing protein
MPERTVFESVSQRHVVSLAPQASVWDAACIMTKANRGSILVIDAAGVVQGILTERDLMMRVLARALDPKTTPVADVMTRNPQSVTPETRVAEAVLIMIERGFRHLPIITASGKIMGIFSVRDALPREVGVAVGLAEFNDQVNDVLG